MKKEYIAPEIEIETFATEEIMAATSGVFQDIFEDGDGKGTWGW